MTQVYEVTVEQVAAGLLAQEFVSAHDADAGLALAYAKAEVGRVLLDVALAGVVEEEVFQALERFNRKPEGGYHQYI